MHQSVSAASSRERYAKPLFLATIVTGSFLLFLTQPMVARMALPRLGGAPAVWNSAMLVYQALLLGGYAYAHGLARLQPRRQAGLHLALFGAAALWLPIGLSSALPPANFAPALWVPWVLLASIGPLIFNISAPAPLRPRWSALVTSRGVGGHPGAARRPAPPAAAARGACRRSLTRGPTTTGPAPTSGERR